MQLAMGRWIRHAAALMLAMCTFAAMADDFGDTVALFKSSSESAGYFNRSYGYAVFPTVGEGGFVVAGGHGTGQVYVHGRYVGDAAMTQVSVGSQVGAQVYSQIIFFQNKAAFDQFASGNFEFAADASAVAITAAATGSAGTKGASAGISTTKRDAGTLGGYRKGMAVFTIVKGGAMIQAALGGQKYTYKPKGR